MERKSMLRDLFLQDKCVTPGLGFYTCALGHKAKASYSLSTPQCFCQFWPGFNYAWRFLGFSTNWESNEYAPVIMKRATSSHVLPLRALSIVYGYVCWMAGSFDNLFFFNIHTEILVLVLLTLPKNIIYTMLRKYILLFFLLLYSNNC